MPRACENTVLHHPQTLPIPTVNHRLLCHVLAKTRSSTIQELPQFRRPTTKPPAPLVPRACQNAVLHHPRTLPIPTANHQAACPSCATCLRKRGPPPSKNSPNPNGQPPSRLPGQAVPAPPYGPHEEPTITPRQHGSTKVAIDLRTCSSTECDLYGQPASSCRGTTVPALRSPRRTNDHTTSARLDQSGDCSPDLLFHRLRPVWTTRVIVPWHNRPRLTVPTKNQRPHYFSTARPKWRLFSGLSLPPTATCMDSPRHRAVAQPSPPYGPHEEPKITLLQHGSTKVAVVFRTFSSTDCDLYGQPASSCRGTTAPPYGPHEEPTITPLQHGSTKVAIDLRTCSSTDCNLYGQPASSCRGTRVDIFGSRNATTGQPTW